MGMWIRALAAVAGLAALVWAEQRRPLRNRREPLLPRLGRNATFALLGALAIRTVESPVVRPLAALGARRGWGFVPRLRLPSAAARLVELLLLDYTLFVWHVCTHRQPFLWRFHAVHHADRDLDASTALRFHFGELILSLPWRAAQVCAIGVAPRTLELWSRLLIVSILFHHSNLRLPRRFERHLSQWIMTPRLHGIHHSSRDEERASNWSSGLVVWDRLHGTLCRDVPQAAIRIGLADLDDSERTALVPMLALPFATTDRLPRPIAQRAPQSA